ncbi:MAG: Hsp70 family protein [Deltaproteobacteria bacterium]|nr:Hsp70 family protein [Deltaproteobacteria bacterium]
MKPTDTKHRSARQEFQSRVRIAVAGADEIEEKYATNLSDGGLFVRHDSPPPLGSIVAIEFVLPDGSSLACMVGRVIHARPAFTPGEATAGMGLQFVEVDQSAAALIEKFRNKVPEPVIDKTPPTPQLETIARPERAPLISLDGPVVGIDIGTSNSCVAIMKNGRPQVITSRLGYQIIPSVVFIAPNNEIFVGHRAVEKMILMPGRAIYGSKRFLGRPFASKEVRNLGHFFSYDLTCGEDGRVAACIDDRVIRLEEVAAYILSSLKEIAEDNLGCTVNRAVICVPAYFGETQRQAVREAARLAGFYVERILNEPTAAAVAYGWGRDMLGTIAIYDLGGGTFDVALLRIDGARVEVIATDGDPFLGGSDFDDRVTEYVMMRFERANNCNIRQDPVSIQRIRFAVEIAKRQLSEALSAEIVLPYIYKGPNGFLELKTRIERNTLETLTNDLVERTFTLLQSVLDAVGIKANQLDDVLMVGGQSRSPHVRRLLSERFGHTPSSTIHPDEAVALGAALIADALYSKRSIDLIDVLPASIRVAKADGGTIRVLPRGARLPASAEIDIVSEASGDIEYRVTLYRGENESVDQNTLIGTVRLPSSHALALSGTRAKAIIEINSEGIMSVKVRHPLTGQIQQLEATITTNLP